MRKLIHSNFEIDLSNYRITDTEENPWFLDEIPLKFTFPFEIDLDDESDMNFGFISSYNTAPETLYPLIFKNNDQMELAELELEELTGRKLLASFTYGLDQLPSWDKKLRELPLHNFELEGQTIYEYAKANLNKSFPEIDFCFPAIHVDYDTEEPKWENFLNILNHYLGENFLENEYDYDNFIEVNRNIMQPLAYWVYLLIKGFEYSGLELQGDILTDPVLTKTAVFSPVKYYSDKIFETEDIFRVGGEHDNTIVLDISSTIINVREFIPIVTFTKKGRYLLTGFVSATISEAYASPPKQIYLNDVLIWSAESGEGTNVELEFEITNLSDEIKIRVRTLQTDPEYIVINLTLSLIVEFNVDDETIPTVQNLNKIDLTKAVPDITFSELVKSTLNWHNYDYDVQGTVVTMNKIEKQINQENAFDLSAFEIKEPTRRFRKGYSYLLKFLDSDNDFGYVWEQVFQSKEGVLYSGFQTNDKTSTIEINALPLPLLDRKGVNTVHAFETNESKLYAVVYDGTTNGKNIAKDPVDILLPAVHASSWFKWWNFRINAQDYKWVFRAWAEDLIGLKAKGKAFAYGRYHIIKKIQKTEIQPDLFDVEIEHESME
jgi:hypothetical protein